MTATQAILRLLESGHGLVIIPQGDAPRRGNFVLRPDSVKVYVTRRRPDDAGNGSPAHDVRAEYHVSGRELGAKITPPGVLLDAALSAVLDETLRPPGCVIPKTFYEFG